MNNKRHRVDSNHRRVPGLVPVFEENQKELKLVIFFEARVRPVKFWHTDSYQRYQVWFLQFLPSPSSWSWRPALRWALLVRGCEGMSSSWLTCLSQPIFIQRTQRGAWRWPQRVRRDPFPVPFWLRVGVKLLIWNFAIT